MQDFFPLEPEKLLIALARLFIAQGRSREVAIISNAEAEIIYSHYDNWNNGTGFYNLNLLVPSWLFGLIVEQREECEKTLLEQVHLITRPLTNVEIHQVFISPSLSIDPDWREKAQAWLAGKGISNQGRVRSDNIPSRTCDGLLFRSEPEILLYKALKSLGVAFAPLPVFVKGGEDYKRIEPDFVIIKEGSIMIIEVDGESFHRESPTDAHERIKMLLHEGVHVERVKASECSSAELAASCAKKLLLALNHIKASR